jgi:RNA polymerase sigma factor for flagellar operon FliA
MFEQAELRALVVRALERMPLSERTVLNMYYQQELTLREISKKMKLHESRISQLKTQGINRLRSLMASRWPMRGTAAFAAKVA